MKLYFGLKYIYPESMDREDGVLVFCTSKSNTFHYNELRMVQDRRRLNNRAGWCVIKIKRII